MRIGMMLSYAGGFREASDEVVELEQRGIDLVGVAEAYTFDAVSQLGYLAAKTSRITLASGILQIYTRTPSLTAMTAAGIDFVSEGRFLMGIGASGPQVIEGFHGVPYDAPLTRTREVIEICRAVWRREKLEYEGSKYRIPLPEGQGTGLGKPLKLINHPVRERIPIYVASLGAKSVEQTAAIAEGWMPVFFDPARARDVWGSALDSGKARRESGLDELRIQISPAFAITEDPQPLFDLVKHQLALYIGGMGARGKNFYNDLVRQYGYDAEATLIQDLYLDGRKAEAAAAVPNDLVRDVSLIGPESWVAERIAAFAEAGVTEIAVAPMARSSAERIELMTRLRSLT